MTLPIVIIGSGLAGYTVAREFLHHLETERHNSVRTRNARLAAIKSLFRFAALRHPEHAAVIARDSGRPLDEAQRVEPEWLTHGRHYISSFDQVSARTAVIRSTPTATADLWVRDGDDGAGREDHDAAGRKGSGAGEERDL